MKGSASDIISVVVIYSESIFPHSFHTSKLKIIMWNIGMAQKAKVGMPCTHSIVILRHM